MQPSIMTLKAIGSTRRCSGDGVYRGSRLATTYSATSSAGRPNTNTITNGRGTPSPCHYDARLSRLVLGLEFRGALPPYLLR